MRRGKWLESRQSDIKSGGSTALTKLKKEKAGKRNFYERNNTRKFPRMEQM